MKQQRIYVDTSVIGGCEDEEFADDSRALLQLARKGQIVILLSSVLADELVEAPEDVQEVLADLPAALPASAAGGRFGVRSRSYRFSRHARGAGQEKRQLRCRTPKAAARPRTPRRSSGVRRRRGGARIAERRPPRGAGHRGPRGHPCELELPPHRP